MENGVSLFNDSKYQYNLPDDWKKKALEELNENPHTVLQEVAAFRESVTNIEGLKSRLDDCFLLAFLRAKKFNRERALNTLLKYYKYRVTYPEYFEPLLVSENTDIYYHKEIYKILPQKDSLGRMIVIIRLGNYDFPSMTTERMWRMIFTNLDSFLLDQTFQVGGMGLVLDGTGAGLVQMRHINVKFVKVFSHVMLDTYPVRFNVIHLVNLPIYMHIAFQLAKQFMTKKMIKRFVIHGSKEKEFDSNIAPDILPVAYGGTQPGFDNDFWLNRLQTMEDEIKEHATKYGFQSTRDSTKT